MSPVQLVRLDEPPSRVPIAEEPFWIGRDPQCHLCVWDLRVSRHHAKVRRVRGEYMLFAEGTNPTFVNGHPAAIFTLRSGDEIALTAPEAGKPVRLRFENSLEDVFVPPDASLTAMWATKEDANAQRGFLGRYAIGPPIDGVGLTSVRRALDRETTAPVALKVLGPVEPGPEGDRFLRLATGLAGATHPALARVVEAGISRDGLRAVRWLAMEIAEGRNAALRIVEGAQPPVTVLRRMRVLGGALHLLHERGVVHGDVVPENVLLRADGGATLLDFARSFLAKDGAPASVPLAAEPAFVAPEVSRPGGAAPSFASDVYGLAAAGYAMLTGRPPPRPLLGPLAPGAAIPPATEETWVRALSDDPAARPSAGELAAAFSFAPAETAPGPVS